MKKLYPMIIATLAVSVAGLHAQSSPARIEYRYALVQFAVDSPELAGINERIIREYICPDITKGATIGVTGYTDVVGLEPRNRDLSIRRAENVARVIRRIIPSERNVTINVRGVGEEAPIYANDIPEGRFYNRTVMVTISEPEDEEK